jgi:[protein-PII] uridylyltransferase
MPADAAGFLKRREALISSATAGAEAARTLSDIADRAVSELAEDALAGLGSPWAVAAVGGWGAHRLLPRSDLDLLVLTDAPAKELEPAIRGVLYPLWDAGLDVGHQVRSPRDHLRAVRSDIATLTATLTGRVLCGDVTLGERVLGDVAAYARKHARAITRDLADRPRPGSPYLLEPDLKEGAGGQRDLDELVWVAATLAGRPSATCEALVGAGLLAERELELLRVADDATTSARWALQRRSPRPTSLLTLDASEDLGLDFSALQAAITDTHHILSRVRGRVAKRPTAFDAGPVARPGTSGPLAAAALFALLDRGPSALPELEEASWAGLLDGLAPGFADLMLLRRPALSHLYTVGAHSLRAAAFVGEGARLQDEAFVRLPEPEDRREVQTAALLHDVGKLDGAPGHAERGAAAVRKLGAGFSLTAAQVDRAAVLVREHLLLAETAAGRDIHDENVLLRTADRIGRRALVDELLLLTVADSTATGPGAWTPWHAALVGELADRLRATLSEGVEGTGLVHDAESTRARALAAIGDPEDARPLARFVRDASLRYLAATPSDEVVRHAQLAAAVTASGRADAFEVGVGAGPAPGAWRLSVATRDRTGLFASICGALSLSGLDILAADAYEAPEGVALDVFVVASDTLAGIDTATWAAFERHLNGALADPAGLDARLQERQRHYPAQTRARTHVSVGETGAYATAVEVTAADRIGLLHDLARAFGDSGLQIRWARAVTRDGVASDVFHVTDEWGEPVDDPGVLGHLAMRIRERV